ncbi:hypothetical protein IT417_02885 [bacterium]|nr:hypothetical protein [bacterium]
MQTGIGDNDKRGRIIIVAALTTLLVFFFKVSQQSDTLSIFHVYLNSLFIGVASYIGLLWAFKFQVTLRSMVYVLSQASLIVFVLSMLVEMFIFRRVGRVYEIAILVGISGLMFFSTYASFLMANIFNVGHFKEIPLMQVGKTTSFLLTLLSIYFSTYFILESQLNPYVTIILFAVMFSALILTHIRHLGIPRNQLWKSLRLILISVLISALLLMIVGGNSLVLSLIPAVVAYSIISILTVENLSSLQKFEFFAMTVVAFGLGFFIR